MEIAPGLHAVRLLNVYAFLIDEPQLTLIDAGLIGSRGPLSAPGAGSGARLTTWLGSSARTAIPTTSAACAR